MQIFRPIFFYSLISFFLLMANCTGQTEEKKMEHSHTNELIHETSPYLLQHAHNPVNWHAWNEATLKKAKDENKLMLISIGYSTCHWCHVMEHESFEDSAVAEIMNRHFINIKVDREERPDVDHIYMNAVQLMTGQGGWPLNCFALPDGRPLYGGTYFPKQQWINVLNQIANLWEKEPEKCFKYASELTDGIKKSELIHQAASSEKIPDKLDIKKMVDEWSVSFDTEEGGNDRAPKFPMPVNYEFLLRYYYHTGDKKILNHIQLTLDKMAMGGIYDHIGGGFARYSTDKLWKVPHFEKMLYDNAQLVSLYSAAYQLTKRELYKEVVYETMEFIQREMTDPAGGFYSALDADSEGEEGKFYVWKKEELEKILGEKSELFFKIFNVNETGLWEHGNYILLKTETDEAIAAKSKMPEQQLRDFINESKKTILKEREKRIRPGLDDKIITSWNALMISACCDAYNCFGEEKYLTHAENAMKFIESHLVIDDKIYRSTHPKKMKSDKSELKVQGFFDDYAILTDAYLSLYQSTFEEKYLQKANETAESCFKEFFDSTAMMFSYTSHSAQSLIAKKFETEDNVIPSSNSIMADNLFQLARYSDKPGYEETAKKMLALVTKFMNQYPSSFSNWGRVALNFSYPYHEIVISGQEAFKRKAEFNSHFIPNTIYAGSEKSSSQPLLENRFVPGKTLIYVCTNKTCLLPVDETEKAVMGVRK